MTRNIDHATFTVRRTFAASPARVWRAFTDLTAKRAWFVDTPGFSTYEYRLDCREGGDEFWRGTAPGGGELTLSTHFAEVAVGERILLTYEMALNGKRLSLSLQSLEFRSEPDGTALTLTEHVAHLDGMGTLDDRRSGTEQALDLLAKSLAD